MYDPSGMRSKARFGIALTLAALLGGVLIWMAIGGSLETYASCSDKLVDSHTYRLNCVISPGAADLQSVQGAALSADGVRFQVQDKDDPSKTLTVQYSGTVPDTFKEGREFVLVGAMKNGTFVGERDKLLLKCPSKFEGKPSPHIPSASAPA